MPEPFLSSNQIQGSSSGPQPGCQALNQPNHLPTVLCIFSCLTYCILKAQAFGSQKIGRKFFWSFSPWWSISPTFLGTHDLMPLALVKPSQGTQSMDFWAGVVDSVAVVWKLQIYTFNQFIVPKDMDGPRPSLSGKILFAKIFGYKLRGFVMWQRLLQEGN